MSNRHRAPLASIPQAANSPHRSLSQSIGKRARTQGPILQENEPPSKKQHFQDQHAITPRRRAQLTEGRVFDAAPSAPPNEFQRRLLASSKNTETKTQAEHTIVQWQKHYRNLFPQYNFYLDNVPADFHAKLGRQINHLGARVDKFFSKEVTHIVTTRPVSSSPTSETSSTKASTDGAIQVQTIDPSLLEKGGQGRSHLSLRGDAAPAMDILSRGRQMDMKIWTLEKLQRILVQLIDPETNARSTTAKTRDEDLSRVLRKDRLNGARDREFSSSLRDLIQFKGPFVYIHDMDMKVRPIMMREYAKVTKSQEGAWPQFRSAAIGKCPFVEDLGLRKEADRRIMEREHARKTAALVKTNENMEPPRRSPRKALREVRNVPAGTTVPSAPTFLPPKSLPQMSFPADMNRPQLHVREPAASGIQRSNLTSAVRSQIMSSTTSAPGAKAGTSKEVNELKRKVLERSTSGNPYGSIPSSHRMTDLAGALKTARGPSRMAKARAQERLSGIAEASTETRKKKEVKKDPKPGFCEGCYEKYEDFEEHVTHYRKHRKYALDPLNWTELDVLLNKLQRSR